ncbi:hypothetical protein ACVIHD_002540 [Bradyrhizobium embrapense]
MLLPRTTSLVRLGYCRLSNRPRPILSGQRSRDSTDPPKRFGSSQYGILVDALGALNVVPHIGISMVKLG